MALAGSRWMSYAAAGIACCAEPIARRVPDSTAATAPAGTSTIPTTNRIAYV